MEGTKKTQTVEMTEEQLARYRAFEEAEERKAREAKAKQMREDYSSLVDKEIGMLMPELMDVSSHIAAVKKKVYDDFKTIIELKEEIFRLKKGEVLDVKSHTFTNSEGNARITLGAYQIDNYKDTAEAGIEVVKDYISGLAKDPESEALVKMVLKLLSKDSKGTLKASRIIQLRRLAEETGDERFLEGVQIIEEAYCPVPSKTFVKAEVKGENGEWRSVPLGMTES